MMFNTDQIITMTEANQNFSKVAKKAEQSGSVVIFKSNKPKYLVIDMNNNPLLDLTDEEKITVVAKRVLEKYKLAFQELAK